MKDEGGTRMGNAGDDATIFGQVEVHLAETRAVGVLRRLRGRRARRRAETLQLRRRAAYQNLAWHVQDVLVGCGLFQANFGIGGGRVFRIPQVISVVPGPAVGLNIRMLPGQVPDDFTEQARKIAYNLNVADVRVISLGPSLIRLELLPKPAPVRSQQRRDQKETPAPRVSIFDQVEQYVAETEAPFDVEAGLGRLRQQCGTDYVP